jgi:hypothetical protein
VRRKGFRTGDRAIVVGDHMAAGVKGRLRSPGLAMFDWILQREDSGKPMGVYERNIERLP